MKKCIIKRDTLETENSINLQLQYNDRKTEMQFFSSVLCSALVLEVTNFFINLKVLVT